MDKNQMTATLQALLDDMMDGLKKCESELKCAYVSTILDLIDRIYALDRKLDV